MAMLIRRGAVGTVPPPNVPPPGQRVGGPTRIGPAPNPPGRYTGPIGHGQRRAWLNAQAQNRPGPSAIGQEKVAPMKAGAPPNVQAAVDKAKVAGQRNAIRRMA